MLQAIAGGKISLPRGKGMVTKSPIQLKLRHSATEKCIFRVLGCPMDQTMGSAHKYHLSNLDSKLEGLIESLVARPLSGPSSH